MRGMDNMKKKLVCPPHLVIKLMESKHEYMRVVKLLLMYIFYSDNLTIMYSKKKLFFINYSSHKVLLNNETVGKGATTELLSSITNTIKIVELNLMIVIVRPIRKEKKVDDENDENEEFSHSDTSIESTIPVAKRTRSKVYK